MSSKAIIEEFLAPRKLAIAGVSRNEKKFGHEVFKELSKKKFDVCPINPNATEIAGIKCYPSVSDIPEDYRHLLILTKNEETDQILRDAANKGITHVWVQQMSNTRESRKIAEENNIKMIEKECIFMFAEPVKGFHKFHRTLRKIFRGLPK